MKSKPESPGFLEEWHKGAIDVESHEGLDSTQELASDEDGRDGLLAIRAEVIEHSLDVVAGGMFIELDDGGSHAKAEEEALGHGAHAAATHAEHNHCIAGGQLPHCLVWALQVHHLMSCSCVDCGVHGYATPHSDS